MLPYPGDYVVCREPVGWRREACRKQRLAFLYEFADGFVIHGARLGNSQLVSLATLVVSFSPTLAAINRDAFCRQPLNSEETRSGNKV